MKSLLNIYLLLALPFLILAATQGTEAFFISPTSIFSPPQLSMTLNNISSSIKIEDTYFNHSSLTYGLQNIQLEMVLNEGRMVSQILKPQVIQVHGGRIQLLWTFNYSKKGNGQDVKGWGFGSVLTDAVNYTKSVSIGTGIPFWQLDDFQNITVTDRIKIKRIDPYNIDDLDVITNMFDRAINATPSTVQHRVIQQLNTLIPKPLNDTLNHEALGQDFTYNYTSPSKGNLQVNFTHKNYGFNATPGDGLKFVFVTQIKDWDHQYCSNKTVPQTHLDWSQYGGVQTIHLNCMYEQMVRYMQKKGWLDTKLDQNWQSNGFQFYAGDLYDVFSKVNEKISPTSPLSGECKARQDGIGMRPDQTFEVNTYLLNITFDCSMKATNLQKQQVQVVKFEAQGYYQIQASVQRSQLVFQILDAEVRNMKFTEVNDFPLKDSHLALFKANQAMTKLLKTYTFGTGFPTLPKRFPRTKVFDDYVIYFDHSARGPSFEME